MDVNCSNLIQTNWVGELKKCEGNGIKQIIGIAKRCHTSPIYGAMNMESTVNSIMIQQMKFIKRIQSNEYLNEFSIYLHQYIYLVCICVAFSGICVLSSGTVS
jgi:hypothetical protein